MHVRFASDMAVQKPKTYAEPGILPHLKALVPYLERVGGQKSDDFVMVWSENPRGAVTTLGNVLTETMRRVGDEVVPQRDPQGRTNADAGKKIADELNRFLRFVRREFSDSFDDNVSMSAEFKPTVNRSWESALNAKNLGLSPTAGAWRTFFNFVEAHARRPFVEAVEAVEAASPKPDASA